jgi:hypothetical protein
MGLVIGEKNVVLEKRLKGVYIQRTSDLEKTYVTIRGSKGFYDENNKWNEINEFDIVLKDDEVLFLMGIPSTKLKTNKLGEMIYKAAYGILSGDIPVNCTLNVKSNVDGTVKIYKDGVNIYQIPTNTPFELPLLINTTVSVEAPGYKEYTTTIPLLQGEVTLNVDLEPAEPPEELEESREGESENINGGPESDEGSVSEDVNTTSDSGSESESGSGSES